MPAQPLVVPERLLQRAIATLDPGYFAWVMATGIVSVGTDLLGDQLLSQVVLGVAAAAFVGLVVAYAARLIWYRPFVRQSATDPTTAMAYFTLVAGTDVLAVRLVMAGHPLVAFWLGATAATTWLLLTYALPWLIVADAHRPVLGEINGTWLVWVVATQSLAIVAAATTPEAPAPWLRADLPAVAVCLWGLGVMLYVVLIVIIFLRLLLIEVLWAFGTWWIPLLVLLGVWRYVLRRYPRSYEPRLWNVVFPLGMYTVATWTLGRTPGLGFMAPVSRVWVWVGFAAWVAVLASMLLALGRVVSRRTAHR